MRDIGDRKSVEVTRWGLRKGKADRERQVLRVIESDGLGHPDNG